MIRPFYATLDSREEAERLGERALAELNTGAVPTWMRKAKPEQSVCIAKAIADYRAVTAVPHSAQRLLDTISAEIGSYPLNSVDHAWCERWIGALKLERRRAPGTIRKKKGA